LKRLVLFFSIGIVAFGYTQEFSQDSLKYSFNEVLGKYTISLDGKNGKDSLVKYYAELYLFKSRTSSTLHKIYGQQMMLAVSSYNESLMRLDTMLYLSESLSDKTNFPVTAYVLKGITHFKNQKYNEALDNFLQALNESLKVENEVFEYIAKYHIAVLKYERVQEQQEALNLYYECKKYYESKDLKDDYFNYGILLLAFSEVHRNNMELDSSRYYNIKGLELAEKYNDKNLKAYFNFYDGIDDFEKKEYSSSIGKLLRVYPILNSNDDQPNKLLLNYYLGRSFYFIGDEETGAQYFHLMDSIFNLSPIFNRQVRESYTFRTENARKERNIKKELSFVNKTLKLDSLVHTTYRNVSRIFNTKYDNFELLNEKKRLTEKLLTSNVIISNSRFLNNILIITGLVLVSFFIYLIYLNRIYKIRFNKLIKNDSPETITKKKSTPKELKIPEEIVNKVIMNLDKFEDQELFLNKNLTSLDIARKVKTNKKYLAKIIKNHKGKTMPQYINDLRINYAVEKLKRDDKFRKYTISSIAKEVGFSNVVSFSQAFKKSTDLKPSFFIKQLINYKDSQNL